MIDHHVWMQIAFRHSFLWAMSAPKAPMSTKVMSKDDVSKSKLIAAISWHRSLLTNCRQLERYAACSPSQDCKLLAKWYISQKQIQCLLYPCSVRFHILNGKWETICHSQICTQNWLKNLFEENLDRWLDKSEFPATCSVNRKKYSNSIEITCSPESYLLNPRFCWLNVCFCAQSSFCWISPNVRGQTKGFKKTARSQATVVPSTTMAAMPSFRCLKPLRASL